MKSNFYFFSKYYPEQVDCSFENAAHSLLKVQKCYIMYFFFIKKIHQTVFVDKCNAVLTTMKVFLPQCPGNLGIQTFNLHVFLPTRFSGHPEGSFHGPAKS